MLAIFTIEKLLSQHASIILFLAFHSWCADLVVAWPLSIAGVWKIEASGGLLLASVCGSESTPRKKPSSAWRWFVMASCLISCYCWFFFLALSALSFSFFSAFAAFLIRVFVSALAFPRCISHWSLNTIILTVSAATGSSRNLTFLEARTAFKAVFCLIQDIVLLLLGIMLCKQARIARWCFSTQYQGTKNWMRASSFISKLALLAIANKQLSDTMIRLWGIGFSIPFSFHKRSEVFFFHVFKAAVRYAIHSWSVSVYFVRMILINGSLCNTSGLALCHYSIVVEGLWRDQWLCRPCTSCHHNKPMKKSVDREYYKCNQKFHLEGLLVFEDRFYWLVA